MRTDGERGLIPRYPATRKRKLSETTRELIPTARTEHRYGTVRTKIWLSRVHHLHVDARTVRHVFRDIGVPRLTKTFSAGRSK